MNRGGKTQEFGNISRCAAVIPCISWGVSRTPVGKLSGQLRESGKLSPLGFPGFPRSSRDFPEEYQGVKPLLLLTSYLLTPWIFPVSRPRHRPFGRPGEPRKIRVLKAPEPPGKNRGGRYGDR